MPSRGSQKLQNTDTITLSLIADTAKVVARTLRRGIEKKTEKVLGNLFGLKERKERRMQFGC